LLFPLVHGASAPFFSSSHGLTGGDDRLHLRDIDHRRGLQRDASPRAYGRARAHRYWQFADSDDALSPHGALSSAVLHEVVERSDERLEGLIFERHGTSPAHWR